MTSTTPGRELVPATDVEIVVARLGAELRELERRLAAATQVATQAEDHARVAGADLEASAWTMTRLRRFLEAVVAEEDASNRALVDVARRHSNPYPPARVLASPATGVAVGPAPAPGPGPELPPWPQSRVGPAVSPDRVAAASETPGFVAPVSVAPFAVAVVPEATTGAATDGSATGTSTTAPQPIETPVGAVPARLVHAPLATDTSLAPVAEAGWDGLTTPAVRDPDEPFWPDGINGARERHPAKSRRVLSVNNVLRLGSVVCIAGAGLLRFG